MENDKRQLNFSGRLSSVQQGPLRRNRNRHQSEARVKRQQQQQGRRALLDQPFRRCGDDGKWKGKLGFCQGNVSITIEQTFSFSETIFSKKSLSMSLDLKMMMIIIIIYTHVSICKKQKSSDLPATN